MKTPAYIVLVVDLENYVTGKNLYLADDSKSGAWSPSGLILNSLRSLFLLTKLYCMDYI